MFIPRPVEPYPGLIIVLVVIALVLLMVYSYTRKESKDDEEY
jgi:hypothetical protein